MLNTVGSSTGLRNSLAASFVVIDFFGEFPLFAIFNCFEMACRDVGSISNLEEHDTSRAFFS